MVRHDSPRMTWPAYKETYKKFLSITFVEPILPSVYLSIYLSHRWTANGIIPLSFLTKTSSLSSFMDDPCYRSSSRRKTPIEEALSTCDHAVSCGERPSRLFASVARETRRLGLGGPCSVTWVAGEAAYKCRTCELDRTSAICVDCFRAGDHEGHDYALVRVSGGCCDCGDVQSWETSGFCREHSPVGLTAQRRSVMRGA